MIKPLAKAIAALSLMLTASVGAPAWSADKHNSAKCPYSKHKHAKRTAVASKAPAGRSVMLVEQRKLDIQILSFGP